MRRRLDAVILEDRFDRVAGHVVPETLEPTADPRIAPGRVLLCHADRQPGKVRLGARAARASRVRAVVFLRHERPISPQDCVRRDDADDARKATPAENLAFHRQAAPLVVGETEAPRSVRRAQDSVLFEQVVNDCLLLPVDPAGKEQDDERERRRQRVHDAKRAPTGCRRARRETERCKVGRPPGR